MRMSAYEFSRPLESNEIWSQLKSSLNFLLHEMDSLEATPISLESKPHLTPAFTN